MVTKIEAEIGNKIKIEDDVLDIYQKIITPYGNGAKIDSQKRYIGKRAIVIVLED